jgi:phage terminase large subunit-like protein
MPIIHFVGATAGDARDIMIEGESGILKSSPSWDIPKYEPSKRKVTWKNGAHALIFTADEPDRLRGPQCFAAWCDEMASWRYPEDAWDNLMMGLRLGSKPRVIATTTPRPTRMIKELLKDPNVFVTHGTTYENIANLAPAFLNTIITKYEGTRMGRQELMAELLEDVEGALWTQRLIDETRVKECPELVVAAIAIDPAVTSKEGSDDTGIIRGGMDAKGEIYICEDNTGIYTPNGWATIAISKYDLHKLDCIVGEVNNGGELIETVIRNIYRDVKYKPVWASRGKTIRAQPIVGVYEQKRVHHVGMLPKLEDEMTSWVLGDPSPNRIDALVWLCTFLMEHRTGGKDDDCVS